MPGSPYTANWNLIVKVLDFVQSGGPERTVLSPSQKSDVLKVVDFMVSASADMRIFSDVFPS